MAGAGAESTLETQKMCDQMGDAGADCFLIVTPFFYKNAMDSDALIQHFTEVRLLFSFQVNNAIGCRSCIQTCCSLQCSSEHGY